MSVLTVGSVAYDGIESPFGKVDRILGGSATYISLAASYFTDPIRLVGVVGRDFSSDDFDLLKSKNIDLDGLQIDKSGKTFFWQGRYHYDLNERDTLDTQLNVFEKFDPIIPEAYKNSDYLSLGNIEPGLQRKVLDQVNAPKFIVMDTMNFWIEGTRDSLIETIREVDMLVINDSESRELADEPNLIKAAEKIMDLGPSHLIIKKGEHGALLFTDDGIFSVPAFPVIDIFDPTGAGDTFMGGLIGWIDYTDDLSDENLRRAVVFGSVMASYCVEKFGPEKLKSLTQDEIYNRYKEFQELSSIPSHNEIKIS